MKGSTGTTLVPYIDGVQSYSKTINAYEKVQIDLILNLDAYSDSFISDDEKIYTIINGTNASDWLVTISTVTVDEAHRSSYGVIHTESGTKYSGIHAGVTEFKFIYAGNDFFASSETTVRITVNPLDSSISADNVVIDEGETASLNISLKDLNYDQAAIANQTVIATVGGKNYTAKTNDEGIATINISSLDAGTYDVNLIWEGGQWQEMSIAEAWYESEGSLLQKPGDYLHAGSTGTAKITVNSVKAATNFTDLSNKQNLYVDETATVEVTLIDENGNKLANKSVNVYVDGSKASTLSTDSNGKVSFNGIDTSSIGTKTVLFEFTGDENYTAANNVTTTVTVKKIPTAIIDVTSQNITVGNIENLTATLIDKDGNPISNKTIKISLSSPNSSTLSSSILKISNDDKLSASYSETTDNDGKISISLNDLEAGEYTATFNFEEDDKYLASENNTVFTVSPINTKFTNLSENQTVNVNDAVSVSTTLVDENNNPLSGKTVNVYIDGTLTGTATTDNEGKISFSNIDTSSAGSHTVTFEFTGDDNYTAASNVTTNITIEEEPDNTSDNETTEEIPIDPEEEPQDEEENDTDDTNETTESEIEGIIFIEDDDNDVVEYSKPVATESVATGNPIILLLLTLSVLVGIKSKRD